MADRYECLRLSNQLCFPLYAASREVVRLYTPLLSELGLTYTQYLVLLVLWEQDGVTVGDLGKRLFLDTGTLSPLLKGMEKKSLLVRKRDDGDERVVRVCLTPEGSALRSRAVKIPAKVGSCLSLSPDEARTLYTLLYKLLSAS